MGGVSIFYTDQDAALYRLYLSDIVNTMSNMRYGHDIYARLALQ